jgi:hypothetical protein
MPRYKTRKRPATTAASLEALLRDLQLDAEARGSEATKQRRRLILKGFRASLWAVVDKPGLHVVAQYLRAELFGYPLTLPEEVEDVRTRCQPGTADADADAEVESNG